MMTIVFDGDDDDYDDVDDDYDDVDDDDNSNIATNPDLRDPVKRN